MGSTNSRLGSRPSSSSSSSDGSGLNRFKRSSRLLSYLFCGLGSVSQSAVEMGDHPDESLIKSCENLAPCCNEPVRCEQQSSSTFSSETGLCSSTAESGASSGGINGIVEDPSAEFSLSKLPEDTESHSQEIDANEAGTSLKEQPAVASVSADATLASLVDQRAGNLHSDGESTRDVSSVSYTVESGPVVSDSLVTSQLLPRSPSSEGEQDTRGASVLFVDVVSIHSHILSSSIAEISNREARNTRRMFWDTFSRSSFRRNSDFPTIVFTTSHADDLGSHDRWLLDFSGDLHYDGLGRESTYSSTRSRHRSERRWQTRYEMSERFHDVHDEHGWQMSLCRAGLHPRGTCSCESSSMPEESSNRASISQIIVLADALVEVLEEIHHHSMSLSLSMLSVPAPESVVNSLLVKNYKKLHGTGSGTHDLEQCHICLVDYEEGDKIRVLPCSHEYHMSCVDKWLKEVNGVCPLCREDVCKGVNEGSATNQEIPSL